MIPLNKGERELLLITPDDELLETFPKYNRNTLRKWKRQLKEDYFPVLEKARTEEEIKQLKSFNDELKEKLLEKDREMRSLLRIVSTPQSYKIKRTTKDKLEAVAVIVASDWHAEEKVDPKKTNGLNEFNLEIADQRINRFFNNTLRLLKITERDTRINDYVLALLGDFISGNIHEDIVENVALKPIEAILWVQDRIRAGIEFLLNNTKKNWTIVCHSGNHSRITSTNRITSEAGNSLEYFMYNNIAHNIQDKRVKWMIAEGYHTYLDVFNYKIRFHHGHAIRYNGGVGGIFIPSYKAIAQWNKAIKADLDIFAHFHQLRNGGNFICNGSLIGYNPYGIWIKGEKEPPRQKFLLYSSGGEIIDEHPIFL